MKRSNLIFAILSTVMICGCYAPSYLPTENEIDINRYGAYIIIKGNNNQGVRGELLSVDSTGVLVLNDSSPKTGGRISHVSTEEMKSFSIQYAQPHQYGWTIPVSALATISHGFFLVGTMPINIIVTASVTAGGQSAFRYDEKSIQHKDLKMFARFPQGIPPGLDVQKIKSAPN